MSRLKSELWVQAYMRRLQTQNIPAVIVRRGNEEAGAIYISIARLDGSVSLFGPAPAGLSGSEDERRFVPLFEGHPVPEAEASAHLAREAEFDSDIWIVEAEDRSGRHLLDDWLADTDGF